MRIASLFENPYLDSVLWRIPTWIPSPQHTPFQIPSFWKNMSKFRPSGMYLTEIRRNSTSLILVEESSTEPISVERLENVGTRYML